MVIYETWGLKQDGGIMGISYDIVYLYVNICIYIYIILSEMNSSALLQW